jgi:hypothetical protein
MRNSGQLECPSPARPEDEKAGATRGSSRGATGGPKPRGNLELHRWERRRMRNSGQLEYPSPAKPEDARMRGNPQPHREAQLEVRSRGVT